MLRLSQPRSPRVLSLALFAFGGCATAKVDDMSAEQHESAAAYEKAAARQSGDRYDPKAVRFVDLYPEALPGCDKALTANCSPGWSLTKNPTDRELSAAAAHLALAKKHREAAKALRDAEATACSNVSLADRDMSPFLHTADLRRVDIFGRPHTASATAPAGASILFAAVPGLTARILQQIVECHLARNAAMNYDPEEMTYCPLNVRGATARVRSTREGLRVDVTAKDPAAAEEIDRRAALLASSTSPPTSMR